MTHPTWELPVADNGAALVLTPCPGTKGVSLSESIAQLKAQGVTMIVTALSSEELAEHQLTELPQEIEKAGLVWAQTAIEDDAAPTKAFLAEWQKHSASMHQAIDKGEKVAMHCMGGSGRTGLLAAHFLLEKGWPLAEIIAQVKERRPGAFTKEQQVECIHQFAEK